MRVAYTLSDDVVSQLKHMAEAAGMNVSKLVEHACRNVLRDGLTLHLQAAPASKPGPAVGTNDTAMCVDCLEPLPMSAYDGAGNHLDCQARGRAAFVERKRLEKLAAGR